MEKRGKVYLVGAGPGDPELLTLKALRMLGEAHVVLHDRLVSREILDLAPRDARIIPVGKAPDRHPVPQERINALLVEHAVLGRTVVRLKGGDPLIFGRGSEEAGALAAAGIHVECAPGITAAQGAACSAGVPLTHRGLASSVRYITGHCRNDLPLDFDWSGLADPETTLVIYMGVAQIREIAARLVGHGLSAALPVLAVANATTRREWRCLSRLDRIADDLPESRPAGPMLFIVGRVVSLYRGSAAEIVDRLARLGGAERVDA